MSSDNSYPGKIIGICHRKNAFGQSISVLMYNNYKVFWLSGEHAFSPTIRDIIRKIVEDNNTGDEDLYISVIKDKHVVFSCYSYIDRLRDYSAMCNIIIYNCPKLLLDFLNKHKTMIWTANTFLMDITITRICKEISPLPCVYSIYVHPDDMDKNSPYINRDIVYKYG